MSKVDTGGQAFPRLGAGGMTLLDYFAANATEKDYFPYTRKETSPDVFETRPIEEARYLYAQAMVQAKRDFG